MATKAMLTIEQYEQLPDTGVRTELVDGEVVELATGTLLQKLVRDRTMISLDQIGAGLAAVEGEFRTSGERVRRADVVWFAAGRLVTADLNRNLLPAPDLAVEVISPKDYEVEVRERIHEYLDAGVNTVWVIYPANREADIWNRGRTASAGVDTLDRRLSAGLFAPRRRCLPERPRLA